MGTATQAKAPLFTRSALVALIWPLFLEQTLSVTMGMADTLMVAGVGEAAVSSVSLVDSLNILIIQILAALATGGAVVASQYMGRRDQESAQRSAAQLYSVLAISTVAVGVLCLALSRPILRGVFGSIDDEVMHYAQQYFIISAISYPFIGLYNGGAALFRAQGNSRISMLASLVMNVINIGGNPLRVAGFADLRPRKEPIMKVLAIGVPSGLENGMFQIGKLCVSSLTSTLGTAAIAANAVANSVCTAANVPGATMNLAMIPVVGRCLGAGDKEQAKKYSLQLTGIAIVGLGLTNLAMFLLLPEIITWFHLSAEAASMCTVVVHWFSVFCVVFWAPSFTLPNALRSGGDAKFTMLVSIASMWVFRVILSYFFVLQMHMGLTGVWFGMFVDWICRSILFGVRFYSGKWMEHKVI